MAGRADILGTIRRAVSPRAKASHEYWQQYDRLKEFPEANPKGGSMFDERSLRRKALWAATPHDLSTPHGTPWNVAQARRKAQHKDAEERAARMLPYIRRYVELRQAGVNHNDAVDDVLEFALSKGPGKSYEEKVAMFHEVKGVFDKTYVGNRAKWKDVDDEQFWNYNDVSRTIRR